ncbi:YIP1 family protein [Paenibacillus mendelii]|uniref:YIP1 family protein n=1 Tax=Paenibacillus mendelii TaxID=206163 RepID=A0ABV6JI15_9BACL|nr:YIP1 family protein [Paenibacillus mendelii]MCQ6563347.1 YIP1 family protein [Paenibacillus mendelii]
MQSNFHMRFIGIALIVLLLFPAAASAAQPYDTFYISHGTGGAGTRTYWMQDVYILGPTAPLSGEQTLNKPSDLFIARNDHVFIADKGNNRIVETDDQGRWIRSIGDQEGKGMLKGPEGVFVRDDGTVYVADTGNQRVAVFDEKGTFVREYGTPTNDLMPKDNFFVPIKLAVDARGVMFVVSKGSYQGIVRLNPQGEFTGFFGGNKAAASFIDRIKRQLFTKEQLAQEDLKRPPEISNITIDKDGFFYTTTFGSASDQIKKLNARGVNRLSGLKTVTMPESDQIADIAADESGFFYVLDRKQQTRRDGMISIYGPGGTELFRFGKTKKDPQQRGVFSYPISFDIDSRNRIWVLDSDLNVMQSFERTVFGDAVLTAAADYYVGDYKKSKENWALVRTMNELVSLTYLGLGEAAQKEGNMESAMAYFKMSFDNEGYSEAFWTYRMEWIEAKFVYVFLLAVILWLLYRYVINRVLKRFSNQLPSSIQRVTEELADGWRTMFHPYDGFYRMKGKKLSIFSLLAVLVMVMLGKLASLYWTGFIFNPINLSEIKLGREIALFFAPLATWVVANYLVSTVKDGEGRFRDVLQASIFSLMPYAVLIGPIVLFSNILVLEEGIIVSSLTSVMWLWTMVLFVVNGQVIHNFDFMENMKNSFITLCTIGLIWIFVIVSTGLTFNVTDFIYQLYKEVAVLG